MATTMTANEFVQSMSSRSAVTYVVNEDGSGTAADGLRIVRINILDEQTGEAIEEVNVMTHADSVYFQDGLTLPEELEFLHQFTNNTPTTTTVGGVEKGTMFDRMTFKEIFQKLFYPYVKPNVSISLSTGIRYFEFGNDISPIIVTATVEKTYADIVNVAMMMNGTRVGWFDSVSPSGGTFTYIISSSIVNDADLYVIVSDGTSTVESPHIKLAFNRPVYTGAVKATDTINNAIISALTKHIDYADENDVSITHRYTIDEKCFLFAYMNQYADKEEVVIRDKNGYDITNSFTSGYVDVTDIAGSLIRYKYWKSNLTTQNAFDVAYQIKA